MKEQILRLMEAEKLSPAKFADEIGVQRSNISHILSERNKPSYDFIMRILDRFKNINPEWLLTGLGNIYKSETVQYSDLFDLADKTTGKTIQQLGESPKTPENIGKDKMIGVKKETTPYIDKRMFTNVNRIRKVILIYEDGTFNDFSPNE